MKPRCHPFWIAGGIAFCCLAMTTPTQAQIVPDATLGAESSVVTPNVVIRDLPSDRLDGGAIRGANLFHSFQEFNVGEGRGAYFTNPAGIENILSRVKGGSRSNILGRLGVLGNANLFMINPNGIIFGPNASLDIGGSFLASTASSLRFADGTEFSATKPQTKPLLTVSVPLGLQFGGTAGSILNQSQATNSSGVGLQVPPSKTLALVGGNVRLDGGTLEAPGGRVELGGISGSGTVGLNVDGNNLRLSFPNSVTRADVSLTNSAEVNVRASGGGSIAINAQNLDVLGGSRLRAGIESGLGAADNQAGDITLNVIEAIAIANGGAYSGVESEAVGNGGDINITSGSLALTNGAQLQASTFGQGNAGSVKIIARDTISFDGVDSNGFSGGAFSRVGSGAVGNGGNIDITTGSLSVTNGAGLSASSEGSGAAGNIEVTARSIRLGNKAFLSSNTTAGEGSIILRTQDLVLRRGSKITTNATGTATGGNITISTGVITALENSDISANAQDAFGGQVIINAQGIFGTEFRNQETSESDSTASSNLGPEFSGTVEINTPDVDPSRGLVNLPAEPANAEVAQGCQAGRGQDKSEFVVTGHGGLPPSPGQALSSDAELVGWVTSAQPVENRLSSAVSTNSTRPTPDTLVEAQGWVVGPKGEVVLTAQAPTDLITQELPSTLQRVQKGRTLYEAEQFSEAASVLQQAAAAFRSTGDGVRQAMTLSNLSLAYQQLGQWPQATEAIAESLNLLQTEQNMGTSTERTSFGGASLTQILAQALDVQGRLQLAQGQAYPALATWQQAVATYTQAGDQAGVTRSSINQVQALQALGLYRQAQKTLTHLNQTLRSTPDSLTKAVGLRSLGDVLQLVGDLDQSHQILQQSLEIAQRLQSPQEIGAALLSLGNTARAQHDTKAALAFYQQATTVSTSKTTRIQTQLNQLSLLVEESKRLSAAQALWPQIQSQIANLTPSRTAVYARINFAQSLIRLKQSSSVADAPSWSDIAQQLTTAGQQAKNLGDQRAESYALGTLGGLYEQTKQLSSAQNLTQQALLLSQAINAPDVAYRWQWQLGRLLKAEGDIKGAIAAYTEAVSNIKSLRSDLVAINPEVQFSFQDKVEPVYRELVDLLLRAEGNSAPSQENLQKARQVMEVLQLAELENFLRCSLQNANPVQIDKVVDQDNPTAAVIYPIILKDRLEVILKLPQQGLRHYTTLIPQSEVEDTLEDLRQNLELPYTFQEVSSLSKRVYDWLIRPIEADLAQNKVETLVFVLDGSLRNIPMAALYDGKHYLVEKYGVALTPGLQLLDPKPLKRTQLKALTAGLSPARLGFAPLPSVERELDLIKSEVPSVTLLNQKFTSTALQNQIDNRSFSVLHLATHGQFSSNPDETFILAWDGRINVNELGNLLESRDQSRPDAIELLVLSACETAAGDKRAGLGIAGTAVRAGARSTLASLWTVENTSVADFMGQFYQVLAKPTVNKAEALRRAQLVLLQQPQYRHPFYWAPYVLLGNWL